jgi:hemolysin III
MLDDDTAFAVVTRGLKPRFRGIPDVIAVIAAVPAAALLIAYARSGPPTTAAAIYGICLVLLFGISATYHTPHWSLEVRRIWRRLDHSAIYVLIAGSYTPVFMIALPESEYMLAIVWSMTILGFVKTIAWERAPRWLNTTVYVAMGHLIAFYLPDLYARAPWHVSLWAAGGGLYLVGSIIYIRRWPNPWPLVFGYHEIFHLFVVAAAVSHYIAFWRLLT